MSALKTTREEKGGICGGVGAAHTPTYNDSPRAADLFSMDSQALKHGAQKYAMLRDAVVR